MTPLRSATRGASEQKFIEHTAEHVRAEKTDSIQRAYKFLDAPADNQQRGKELVAALQWSLDFIMKHSEGRAGPELAGRCVRASV
jgi:hypothetical protein